MPENLSWRRREALELRSFGSSAAFSKDQVMSVHEHALCQLSWTRGDDLAASFEAGKTGGSLSSAANCLAAMKVALGINFDPMRRPIHRCLFGLHVHEIWVDVMISLKTRTVGTTSFSLLVKAFRGDW